MLSELYAFFHSASLRALELLSGVGVTYSLIIISVVAGALLVLCYGKISAQARIAAVKREIAANILESVIFRHDIRTSLKAQAMAMFLALRYAGLAIPPLLVLALPTVLLLGQMYPHFGLRELIPGEAAVVTVAVESPEVLSRLKMEANGVADLTPAVHVPGLNEVSWRVIADQELSPTLKFELSDGAIELPLMRGVHFVSSGFEPLSTAWLLGAQVVPESARGAIRSVAVTYPERDIHWLGISWNWIVLFFIVSLVSGLLVSRVAKIEI